MRIAFLVHALELGGAERQLVLLANGLAARGHDVLVVPMRGGAELEPDLEGSGVTVQPVARSRWWMVRFTWRLPAILRRFRPDVVHSYMPVLNVVGAVARPWVRRAALVFGVRGIRPDLKDDLRRVRVFYGLEARCSRFADAVIANSHRAREYVIDRGFPPERVAVVPNGIDTERFRFDALARDRVRAEWGVAAEDVLVGSVANLRAIKDHVTFVRAAAEVASRCGGARFVCVGDDRDGRQASLAALAGELGVADRIVWAGSRGDIPEVMSALDLLVVSSYAESSPNVIGEAMASGTQCVSTDVGDAARLIGETGEVVEPRSADALAAGIERALERRSSAGPGLRDALAARARSEFGVDTMIGLTEQVLGDAVARRRGS